MEQSKPTRLNRSLQVMMTFDTLLSITSSSNVKNPLRRSNKMPDLMSANCPCNWTPVETHHCFKSFSWFSRSTFYFGVDTRA